MTPRCLTHDESDLVRVVASAFYTKLKEAKTKPGAAYADFETIYESLMDMSYNGCLWVFETNAGHVVGSVAISVCQPWYTKKTCLEEVFVLQLDPQFHGFGRVALKFLKNKAREYGCGLLVTGDALSDDQRMIENLYQRHGHCNFTYKNYIWTFLS